MLRVAALRAMMLITSSIIAASSVIRRLNNVPVPSICGPSAMKEYVIWRTKINRRRISAALLPELDHEMATTRKTLGAFLRTIDWAPHQKSMKLGQLAAPGGNRLGGRRVEAGFAGSCSRRWARV